MNCPLCQTVLPDNATECTRCDWVLQAPERPVNVRDQMAFWLSLVPGLGHIYKGHVILGGVILFLVAPAVLAIGLVLLPMTLGVSLSIPLLFMAAGMVHAYRIKDLREQVVLAARAYDQGQAAMQADTQG